MIKSPNKILKLLVVVGILFPIAQLYVGVISAADDSVSGPEREWADKAYKANKAGKYDEAISYAGKAIQIKPDYADAYNARGLALYNKDQSEKAIKDFDMAIKLMPDFYQAYMNRGNAKSDLGLYDSDIEDQNMAIKLSPNNASAYAGRGVAYHKKKLYDLAVTDYSRSLEIRPNDSHVHSERGDTYYRKGEYDLAIQDYDKSIQLDSNDARTYRVRARAYLKKGEHDKVIADCNRSLEITPDSAVAYNLMGDAYLGKGEYDLAIKDYSRYIELKPDQKGFDGYFGRGMAYKAKGQINEALGDLKKAIAFNPDKNKFKEELTKLEESVIKGASAKAPSAGLPSYANNTQPSGVESLPQPAATAVTLASTEGARVLTPFNGYSEVETCKLSSVIIPGVPWQPEAGKDDATIGSSELGEYEALLRHTMQGLRVFYGSLSPDEDKSFNAFWAPFFDHPTQAALEYFKQITFLLDEMIVALNDLDGMLSNLGAGLEEMLLVAGDPSSCAAGIAAAEYREVKDQRAKIDDLRKRIEALGNPPNPLAAKCRARKRHKQIIQKARPDVKLVWRSIPGTWTVSNGSFLSDRSNLIAGTGEKKLVDNPEFSNTVYFRFAEEEPQPKYEIRAIFEVGPASNYDYSDPEKLAARFRTNKGGITPGFKGTKECKFQGWRAIRYDVGSPNSTQKEWGYFIEIDPARTLWSGVMCHVHAVYRGPRENSPPKEEQIDKRSKLEQTVEQFIEKHIRISSEGLTEEEAKKAADYNQTKKIAATEEARVADYDQAKKAAEEASSDTDDAEAKKEAIAQHAALAEQIRRDAARWAADAKAEKDPKRREDLEKRSGEMYANAQSEQDIADSLRTGIIVHTRTEWDERQHQALVDSAKKEIAVFAMENKLLVNISKVGDMVAGIDGVELREQAQKRISDAIKSPDRLQKLAAIYGELQNKVVNQGEQQMATEQARVDMWDNRVAIAENVQFAASTGIILGALWAPAEIGSLAIGYAGSTGFVEGGVKGATVAVTRSVSMKADAIISAYEGATRIDPNTHKPYGFWGAVEGALWSFGTNKAFEKLSGRIQKAKADYAKFNADYINTDHALAKQGAGGAGFKPVAKAKGEARIKEYDFKTPEQRYKTELSSAKTPQEKAAVEKKYAIQVEREKMSLEMDGAKQKAENDIRQGIDQAKVKESYNKDLNAINEKYKAKETRNQEHQEVMKELGFDAKNDITPTGSAPKNASSDMDFTPQGKTPHESYQKGKSYVEAMKKRGHSVDEYGDRWVDNTNDSTIWKPGFGADKPGSSSFEAEVIFGTLPHSDKFGTKGGIEWTSSETHTTDDPLGAVLANAGKAAGAGLGNSHPKDLHTIGKSAAKAAEAAGIKVEPHLKAQIEALKAHQTPEQAGVLELGANPAAKDQQEKAFLTKVEALMGRAYNSAKAKSDQRAKELQQQTEAADNPDAAYNIRAKLAGYKAGNNAALTTIAQASSGLGKAMAPTMKVPDLIPEMSSGGKGSLNFGGFARELFGNRESASKAPPPPANSNDPAFAGLGARCKEGAKLVSDKLAIAKPGSEEALYLTELKTVLERGSTNPAEAVRSVRGLSGTELAVVLAQLGVSVDSAGKKAWRQK